MKKFLLISITVMLLVAMALPAMAADMSLTATVSKTTAYLGDEVTITISTSGTTPFTSMGFILRYDTDVFEYKSRSWGAAIVEAEIKSFDETSGKVTATWKDPGTYSGEIIKITLTVKKAVPGNTTISFSDAACKNENANLIVGTFDVKIALDCVHNYSNWTDAGNNKHQQVCSKCGDKQEEDHDWNDGTGKPAPTCTEPGTIEYTCLICHAAKTEDVGALGHKWTNSCDTTCDNNCGTVRPAEHNYSMTSDATNHWQECSSCGNKKDVSTHTPGPGPTASSAQLCTVCNYEIKPALSHTHVLEKEWTTDSNYHWHRCETRNPPCYHTADKAKHVYDDDCDVTCNTCAYIREAPHKYRPEWQANAEGHWQICSKCNAKSQVFEHVPGPEATMDTPQICEECNFVIKKELSHVHNYGDTWYSDDESHWQSCADCTESTTMEPHQWDEGVELADGKMQYTCSVCAKQLVTDGPMETQPSTVPTTQPATQKPTEPSDSGRFPWQWAGIAAIVLLIIGVVLLVIEFIRSRKSNMHGKFSK